MNMFLSLLNNTGSRIRLTHPIRQIVAFTLFTAVVTYIFARSLTLAYPNRAVFYFPSNLTGSMKTEIRHLPRLSSTDACFNQFLDEMLLGPVHANLLPLFGDSTRVKSAFIRGKEAYVDLTAGALEWTDGSIEWPDAREIFKKNVFTNFGNIDKINLYIEGQEVYGAAVVDAKPKK